MIVQYLTIKESLYQHLMMVLMFFIFIIYSVYSYLDMSVYLMVLCEAVLAIIVYFLLKKQLANRVVVQPQLFWKTNKLKVVRQNRYWQLIPFVIYTILTVLHFSIVYFSGKSLEPLVYDYGMGGLFAIGLSYYQFKNWMIGICNEGLLIGSKLEGKLITWENVKSVNYQPNKIEIKLEAKYPVSKLTIRNKNYITDFKKLLAYKLNR